MRWIAVSHSSVPRSAVALPSTRASVYEVHPVQSLAIGSQRSYFD